MKVASEAKVDYITFDGAGGGTGMSPVPMMNEMSTPTVYLEAQILEREGKYVPDMSRAGGLINETQMFKAIAMSNFDGRGPFVKPITMARSPLTAAMKALYFTELARNNRLPRDFANKYGNSPEKFFIADVVREKFYAFLKEELPHALGVVVEEIEDTEKIVRISAVIYVERSGHKSIVIGKKGAVLKEAGTAARKELEEHFKKKVFIKLWIKVKGDWRNKDSLLREMGFYF